MNNILDEIRRGRPKKIILESNFDQDNKVNSELIEEKTEEKTEKVKIDPIKTQEPKQEETIDFSKVKKFCCLRHIKIENKGYMIKGSNYSVDQAFKGIKNPEKHLARLYETKKIRIMPDDVKTIPQDMILKADNQKDNAQEEASRIRMLARSRKNNA